MDLELLIGTDIALTVNCSSTARSTLASDILHAQIGIWELHGCNSLGAIFLILETEFLPRMATPSDSP